MLFWSKSEAYTHIISVLTFLDEELKNKALSDSIAKIKAIFENHIQELKVVVDILTELKKILPKKNNIFNGLINSINQSTFQQSDKERFSNPLARRYESELAILLLTNPTDAMMQVVKQVSDQILSIIEHTNTSEYAKKYGEFLKSLQNGGDFINCGAYNVSYDISIHAIKQTLTGNNPKELATIMNIHYKFAHHVSRYVPNDVACHNSPLPLPKLESILRTVWKDENLKDFFTNGTKMPSPEGDTYRSCIDQHIYYKSDLFTAEKGRGRLDDIQIIMSSQYGIMLFNQGKLSEGLHSTPGVAWVPDAKGQKPKLDSQYVKDLIYNDTPYVAGPSGMSTQLLGLGLTIGNFSDVSSVQLYLAAIAAYIVAGGFHSFHEVIGLAEDSLGLIPGYFVSAPVEGKTAAPPNYQVFFDLLAQINPEFSDIREKAWKAYLQFYDTIYLKNLPMRLPQEEQKIILDYINDFINDMKTQPVKSSLTMFSEEKIELHYAERLKEIFSSTNNCEDLLDSVDEIEKLYNMKQSSNTEAFNHLISELNKVLAPPESESEKSYADESDNESETDSSTTGFSSESDEEDESSQGSMTNR